MGGRMKTVYTSLTFSLLPVIALGADANLTPPWAYPATDPGFQRPTDDGAVQHVPGSDQAFTRREITDWFPEDHGPMPDIVAKGHRPNVLACDVCHLPNGYGHPESANIAGETPEYFFQQIKDMQSGKRQNVDPDRSAGMVKVAKAMTDDEIKASADYYAAIKPKPWVTVKEAKTVPATFVGGGNMRFVKPDGGMEPLGQRIIEVPENAELVELRDDHSPFIAYAPVGSVKKGEALVTTGGNGKTLQCAICHGPDLKGVGTIPQIAGLHPTYIFRQLNDIQHGSRDGTQAQLMKAVVAKLSQDDMLNIAAYVASVTP
jgi:cytochrome c553